MSADKRVLLRADMDALPILEATGAEHASQTPGVMHACGHDGHTTLLLGAAKHLSEARDFDGTLVFCFQPAEEGGAGAQAMIEDGLFERFPVKGVYGLHNWPGAAGRQVRRGARAGDGLGRPARHRRAGLRRPRGDAASGARPHRRGGGDRAGGADHRLARGRSAGAGGGLDHLDPRGRGLQHHPRQRDDAASASARCRTRSPSRSRRKCAASARAWRRRMA